MQTIEMLSFSLLNDDAVLMWTLFFGFFGAH